MFIKLYVAYIRVSWREDIIGDQMNSNFRLNEIEAWIRWSYSYTYFAFIKKFNIFFCNSCSAPGNLCVVYATPKTFPSSIIA